MLGRLRGLVVLGALSLFACGAPQEEGTAAASQGIQADGENPDIPTEAEVAAASAKVLADFGHLTDPSAVSPSKAVMAKYPHLDPNREVPADLLKTAVTYFDENKDSFPNKGYITVVDFKPRSDKYRFWLVNMETGAVEKYHTTHGRGGDVDDDGYAESFGNVSGSQKSSLGFIRTAEVYFGTYRRSVRLDGLSKTNSRVRERAIVFHGWDDVHEANVIQGRSAGCVTLDWAVKDAVLDKLKEGSLMYIGLSKTAAN